MHDLIASPFLGDHLVTRPDSGRSMKIPRRRYLELGSAVAADRPVPTWLLDAAMRCWGLDLSGRKANQAVLVRKESAYGSAGRVMS